MTDKTNFGNLPKEYCRYADSGIVVVPVPYDGTSTWVKGADKGPDAVIEASANMELYDIETDSQVYLKGIFTDEPVTEKDTPERMVSAVKTKVARHIANDKFVVTLGGEHSVSIGAVSAHCRGFDDLTILQLDAHCDLRDEYEGSKNNHACVMARANAAAAGRVVQVGIRSMCIGEKPAAEKGNIFFAVDIHSDMDWCEKVLNRLSKNVYITIDLDCFDPSIMPSTGTPEPGGLLWYETIEFLKTVIATRNVVGFDIVELCPNQNNKAPDFLAAKLVYKMLSYRFGKQK